MVPIATLIKQALTKPSILKTLGKYTGRHILRRTGVFGTFGSMKRFIGKNLTKTQIVKAVTSSIIKKNILRTLGPMNYFVDIFKKKGGVKYALKQFGYQRMTPMAIKKVWYLYQNYQTTFGTKNPILQQSKKEIWKQLRINNTKHTPMWKLNQIEGIMESEVPKRFKNELLDDLFRFRVKSPQTHNFSQSIYAWNPKTGELYCSIRSGGGKRLVHYYVFHEYDIQMIKKMVKTGNYGRKIFWDEYH